MILSIFKASEQKIMWLTLKKKKLFCFNAYWYFMYIFGQIESNATSVKDGEQLQGVVPIKMGECLCYPVFL